MAPGHSLLPAAAAVASPVAVTMRPLLGHVGGYAHAAVYAAPACIAPADATGLPVASGGDSGMPSPTVSLAASGVSSVPLDALPAASATAVAVTPRLPLPATPPSGSGLPPGVAAEDWDSHSGSESEADDGDDVDGAASLAGSDSSAAEDGGDEGRRRRARVGVLLQQLASPSHSGTRRRRASADILELMADDAATVRA